jgi:hypothetical protein
MSRDRRKFGDHYYELDSQYGAYGARNMEASREDAAYRAKNLREEGCFVRVRLERDIEGIWRKVWKRCK